MDVLLEAAIFEEVPEEELLFLAPPEELLAEEELFAEEPVERLPDDFEEPPDAALRLEAPFDVPLLEPELPDVFFLFSSLIVSRSFLPHPAFFQ